MQSHDAPLDVAALARMNRRATPRARFTMEAPLAWMGGTIQRFTLGNGLRIRLVVDRRAPVVSYNTWFHVGSRDEVEGKTGLAHLFEHLMFTQTKRLPAGRFDELMERAGAETNAATWNDWTYYYENVPRDQLGLVIGLEAERMRNLVLRVKPVASEKEVVANERRYRVEDDVEGAMSEVLWATAFRAHPYHHPTIGWMDDILNFTPADCREFYKHYYAPDNATLVIVGDVDVTKTLTLIRRHYGAMAPTKRAPRPLPAEPEQREERVVALRKATPTDKVAVGYRAPGLADPDHAPLSVLAEVLTGGRSSRFYRDLVTDRELATDVSGWTATFRDPGLWELTATARSGTSAETLLQALDAGIESLRRIPVSLEERDRAVARMELGFLRGLETVGGRAEQIGFYDSVTGDPAGSAARLDALRAVTVTALRDVATRYLHDTRRTVVLVHAELDASQQGAA